MRPFGEKGKDENGNGETKTQKGERKHQQHEKRNILDTKGSDI